jgi:hypothetical protein
MAESTIVMKKKVAGFSGDGKREGKTARLQRYEN